MDTLRNIIYLKGTDGVKRDKTRQISRIRHDANKHLYQIVFQNSDKVFYYKEQNVQIIRNILEISREGGAPTATLYYDLASFDRPEGCRNLYFGKAEFFDTVSNFLFESQSNHSERVTLTALNPFDRSTEVLGMLSGMSRYPLLPISIKCILSAEPLVEDERLQEELILTQKDIKLIKKLNMFAVEQF